MKEQTKMYTCPMHPEIHRDKEGLCPECGMRLVPVTKKKVGHGEHDDFNKHKGHSTNVFKTKFWVSLVLSIPVVLYSDIVQELLKFTAPVFPGSSFVPFILASIIFFYGGSVFIASAFLGLKAKLPGMMTLISLAI